MPEEQTHESSESERVSRLSSTAPAAGEGDDSVVREYEQRYQGPRDDKAKRKEMPRSYSTLNVTEDEMLWASVAHGSVWLTALLSIMTVGVLVPISVFVPLVIYFLFRKRSDYVAFHALQAFVLQLVGTVGALALLLVGGTVWLVGLVIGLLAMAILIGFILVPVWGLIGIVLAIVTGLMPLGALIYGTIAAIETFSGRDYRYPFIARWVDRQLAGGLLVAP
jgi:uncharacterized Tic20 family protein